MLNKIEESNCGLLKKSTIISSIGKRENKPT